MKFLQLVGSQKNIWNIFKGSEISWIFLHSGRKSENILETSFEIVLKLLVFFKKLVKKFNNYLGNSEGLRKFALLFRITLQYLRFFNQYEFGNFERFRKSATSSKIFLQRLQFLQYVRWQKCLEHFQRFRNFVTKYTCTWDSNKTTISEPMVFVSMVKIQQIF